MAAGDTAFETPYAGGCLCGAVRYVATEAPSFVYYCHCVDCRKAAGTAFHVGMVVPAASVNWTGTPREYAKTAESGRDIVRGFCGDCGGQLYSNVSYDPALVSLKAGTLDDPSPVRPATEIWARSKVDWADLPGDLQSFPRGRQG